MVIQSFLSGNTNKTATISSIANNTTLTLSSGTSLGDGTENQKIGVDTKVTASLVLVKRILKDMNMKQLLHLLLMLIKGEIQELFLVSNKVWTLGPFLKVTDVHAMTGFDLSVDLASLGTGTGARLLDLIELHCVK